MTTNPETDKSVKPFEVGDKVTLDGEDLSGVPAIINSIEWSGQPGWLIGVSFLLDGEFRSDFLAWYDCDCCKLWAVKRS